MSEAAALNRAFDAAMDRLGPFETNPALAAAVSGGADSMALALLANDWAIQRGGTVHALIVDHGLRPGSFDEARLTLERVGRLGIAGSLLTLTTLERGTALAERARSARYQILWSACVALGSLHLLLGHHAADQAETMVIRVLGGSMTHGLAGMSSVTERHAGRVIRPLLTIQPGALRRLLRCRGIDWVEDPSNRDLAALRPRVRHRLATHDADGASDALVAAARMAGVSRARDEQETAAELMRRVEIYPEGFAILSPGRIGVAALACVIRTISGAPYAPGQEHLAELAAAPRPATVGGVQLLPAGRAGDGFLVVREEAAITRPVAAEPGTVWDRRFRLVARSALPAGTILGHLGSDAAHFRSYSHLPAAVLRTLPVLRIGKTLAAVPHLGYALPRVNIRLTMSFVPNVPLAGPGYMPA